MDLLLLRVKTLMDFVDFFCFNSTPCKRNSGHWMLPPLCPRVHQSSFSSIYPHSLVYWLGQGLGEGAHHLQTEVHLAPPVVFYTISPERFVYFSVCQVLRRINPGVEGTVEYSSDSPPPLYKLFFSSCLYLQLLDLSSLKPCIWKRDRITKEGIGE